MNLNFTLVAQAVVFAAFILFTMKFVWPHMLRAIEARQKTIADGLAAADQGRKSLETSSRQAEQTIQDARNRAVFEENFEILWKSWTEKSFRHQGLNWSIPAPYEGIENWQLADAGLTQKLGAPNEVD